MQKIKINKMKKTILLGTGLLLGLSMSAKIWRINNTGITTDFTSLQLAHDNAGVLAGDTLHLEPSSVSYGSLTLSKKLIIIGNGYLLTQNLNLQANPVSSKAGALAFDPGSSGSVIMGLETFGNATIRTGNITISRNNFNSYSIVLERTTAAYSNILISQNYNIYITSSGSGISAYNNINILNNINVAFTNTGLANYFSGTIANNIITTINSPVDYFMIKNNISLATTSGSVLYSSNSTFTHNICPTSNGWPNGNNNIQNTALSSVFVLAGSNDAYYTLKAGSPAIGTGDGGVDRGAFGGPNPYVLSGIPPVPSIYLLSAPSNSNGNQINITISTKTNN